MPLELPDVFNHALVSAIHKATGLTPGDILTALTASTFGFSTPGGGGGVLEKAIDHTWVGNNADNRIVVLGDAYDLVLIWTEQSMNNTQSRMFHARAFRSYYDVDQGVGSGTIPRLYTLAAANNFFQGIVGNTIKLGSVGTSSLGTNDGGITYRLMGLKFSSME